MSRVKCVLGEAKEGLVREWRVVSRPVPSVTLVLSEGGIRRSILFPLLTSWRTIFAESDYELTSNSQEVDLFLTQLINFGRHTLDVVVAVT